MLSGWERRCDSLRCGPLFPTLLNEDRMVDTLECFQTLEGHSGCVNTLRWNKNGTLLASGSDDRNVKIWRAGIERHNIETGHEGNVFAVEFLHGTDDRKLVTGAADEAVMLHDIETNTSKRWELDGRVKRICTVESDPTLYWAAVEDYSAVYQFDTRIEDPEVVVKSSPRREIQCAKSIAVSEANPHLIVVGFDETTVRLYDRRNFEEPILSFAPLFVNPKAYHATHVAFNKLGTEIVVHHGAGGGIYVFSVDQSEDPKILERFHAVLEKPFEPVIASHSLPHHELREIGTATIREKHFSKAIDFYSDLIARKDPDRAFQSVCYSNRAMSSLLRRRRGDTYACIRDCVKALEIHRGNAKALFRLVKSFTLMEHATLAKKCLEKFKECCPGDKSIEKLEKDINDLGNNRPELIRVGGVIDYQQRFIGSSNHQTDIKEANFFGTRDQYIISGSDCGRMFVWNRDTTKLQGIWKADSHILNIVQPHPNQFMLATSGIDEEIRLWQPFLERDADFESRKENDVYQYMESNPESGARAQLSLLHSFARENQCVQS